MPPQSAANCASEKVLPTTEAAGTERYVLPPLPIRPTIRGFDFRQIRWGPYTQNISVPPAPNTTSNRSTIGETLAPVVFLDASLFFFRGYDQFRRGAISNPVPILAQQDHAAHSLPDDTAPPQASAYMDDNGTDLQVGTPKTFPVRVPNGISARGNATGTAREPREGTVSLLASNLAPSSLTRPPEPSKGKSVPRPFTCQECPKAFTTKYYLDRHNKSVHLGELHKCDRCEKGFLSKPYLDRHYKAVHLGDRHKCERCEKDFSQIGQLSRHVRLIHPQE